jgi:hypothetical protein
MSEQGSQGAGAVRDGTVVVSWRELQGAASPGGGEPVRGAPVSGTEIVQSLTLIGLLAATLGLLIGLGFLAVRAFS